MINTYDVIKEIAQDFKRLQQFGGRESVNHELATKLFRIGFDYGPSVDWLVEDIRVNSQTLAQEFEISADRVKWCANRIEDGIYQSLHYLD